MTTQLSLHESRAFQVWLAMLGLSLSLSIAFVNLLVIAIVLYLAFRHTDTLKGQLKSPTIVVYLAVAVLFQVTGMIHDGLLITKAAKVCTLFALAIIIGNTFLLLNIRWQQTLLYSLMIGLALGTGLNLFIRPEYPLWATYSMSYANQAAGFAVTVGLLCYATGKNWLIALGVLGAFIYLVMAGERSGVASLVAAMMVLFFVRKQYKALFAIPTLAIIVITLYSQLSPGSFDKMKDAVTNDLRRDLWSHALLIAQKDHFMGRGERLSFDMNDRQILTPVTPLGENYFSTIFPPELPEEQLQRIQLSYHNQSIQLLVEYGFVAPLLFIALLLFPIVRTWKGTRQDQVTLAAIMIWGGFAMHSVYETSFDNHSAIIVGLICGLAQLFPMPNDAKLAKA